MIDGLGLKRLYEDELEAAGRPGGGDSKHGRRMFRALLKASRPLSPCRLEQDRAWVWSDLHLGHENIIRYTGRPFSDAEAMDAALYREWEATVGDDDALIFVGDLAMRHAVGEHTWERIRAGRGAAKYLVVGNHDLTGGGKLRVDGFDQTGSVMLVDGDPPLVFTHIPLKAVPDGCVNVHGHTHDEPPRSTPHINVSVEQLGYRPVELDRIRTLAKELIAGRYPDGGTTIARLRTIESPAQ